MAGPGRGRGLMLQQLLKAQSMETSPSSTPPPSEMPSAAPSVVSGTSTPSTTATSSASGRGLNIFKLMQMKGPSTASFAPASDVSPSAPALPRGTGRGLPLFQSLKSKLQQQPGAAGDAPSVTDVTSQLSQTTLGTTQSKATSDGKNKFFREVKETPPVVKKGESGRPCEVTSNFVYLEFKENSVFEYEVKYEPDQDYRHMRFKLLNEHRHLFKEKTFDGTTLYIPHRLEQDVIELVSTSPTDESKIKITITFRRLRKLSEMIHMYNVLFKQIMKDLKLVRFGRQHFNELAAIQIPQHQLEVWPGYVTAVDEYEGGLMLTLDSTHRVLRTRTVLSLIHEAVKHKGAQWKKYITEVLIGSSVMTTYNKKLFRVDTVDDSMTPKSTFERTEGGVTKQISFIDYYKKNYGIEIMDWEQPMLISRDTKRMPGNEMPTDFMICLVPELCQMTGLTEDQRSNFRVMKDVATYTRITPDQRHSAFKQYIKNVLENESAKSRLAGWGLSIAQKTVDLTARTLPPEMLYFGNGIQVPGKPNADWNNDATRNPVMQAVDILRWTILFVGNDQRVAQGFVEMVLQCSRPMGIQVAKPQMVMLPSDRTDAYVTALKKCITGDVQMIVAICPTARDDRYAAIKKICVAENPIPSQVINSRTIGNQQKLRAITQKILLQMNCKLGGTLWAISIPCKTAMIIGIDSYHDASRKKRSVCAFVASYNQSMTHWYSRTVFQEQGQEIVDGLTSCLTDAVRNYMRFNGKYPDRVIMYRDGVGDGQLAIVQKYEVPQMELCFTRIDPNYKPTLTYVVVQKRINTRIFLKAGSGFENPAPGTVLDHTITRRDWYDFLMVSQKVTQGTVTPTHYVVVHDDSGMTPDQVQRVTYKMCHLYYNWPGTVRVPAPCQYAHKLAFLVGQVIHAQPSETLADRLFFL